MTAVLNVENIEHSVLGASSADRWMACPGSIRLIRSLPPGEAGKAGPEAAKGTAAHSLCEICLTEDSDAWEHTGKVFHVNGLDFEVDQNMTDAVQVYVDFVRDLISQYPDATHLVERRLHSKLHPQAFGTCDFILLGPGLIVVVDYKHGEGVVVEPNKAQLRYYGYMAYEEFEEIVNSGSNNPDIRLVIVQPRIPHPKGPCREFKETAETLVGWFKNTVVPAMLETEKEDAILNIGEHCRFCPAKNICPAMRKSAVEFKATGTVDALSEAEIADLMVRGKALVAFLKSIEAEAFRRAELGKQIPGYKLVHKQGNRIWKSGAEEVLKAKFGDDAFTKPELRGPAAIDELVGGKAITTRWASKPLTGLTLAPISDSRVEAKPISDMFDQFEAAELANALTAGV